MAIVECDGCYKAVDSTYCGVYKPQYVYLCGSCIGADKADCHGTNGVFWIIRRSNFEQRKSNMSEKYMLITRDGCNVEMYNSNAGMGHSLSVAQDLARSAAKANPSREFLVVQLVEGYKAVDVQKTSYR